MSLVPPPKVQKLQTALHAKAKESPSYRFYRLYDKVYRRDILEFAYLRCRSNDGAPGVDGQTFQDIEAYGRELWLDELTTELRMGFFAYPPEKVYSRALPGRGCRCGGRPAEVTIHARLGEAVIGHGIAIAVRREKARIFSRCKSCPDD
jgi:hypothetical protein